MLIVDKKIRDNRYLLSAGISFLIYTIIEVTDCIFLLLIVLKLAPNLYLNIGIIIPVTLQILTNQPIFFLPFFGSFTLMRIMSTIGILRNFLWGFYIGVISLILTMILTIFFILFITISKVW